jgi:hypothetical protein
MLTATEYYMREPVPLHRAHEAIFDYCRGRADVVVSDTQAVNVHVREPRMSQDVDLLAADPRALAKALAAHLHTKLRIAVRVREARAGVGYRIYQTRKQGTRHLADVRVLETGLDDAVERGGVRYTTVPLTIAMKVCAYTKRRLAPKGATDLADLRRLLLAYPKFRSVEGTVAEVIVRVGGGEAALLAWRQIVREPVVSDEDVDEGY